MQHSYLEQPVHYDGTQLCSLWAYRNFGIRGDSIVAFQGGCHVELTEMVDLEDVLNGAFIHSDLMLHFIVEHFDMSLEKTILRQRLLVSLVQAEVFRQGGSTLDRRGDDLFSAERKLSVSIATASPVSTLIHLGLNLSSKNTPVPTISLPELGIQDIRRFADAILTAYCREMQSIREARCKVRGVG